MSLLTEAWMVNVNYFYVLILLCKQRRHNITKKQKIMIRTTSRCILDFCFPLKKHNPRRASKSCNNCGNHLNFAQNCKQCCDDITIQKVDSKGKRKTKNVP